MPFDNWKILMVAIATGILLGSAVGYGGIVLNKAGYIDECGRVEVGGAHERR
jgi:hypothetical protein